MVEVFKTNISGSETANRIVQQLETIFPGAKITFDLEDCDKILRIENDFIMVPEIQKLISASGFICEVLV